VDFGGTRLLFWDLGGQTDLQSIWASYYADCHAIVFMVDSTDQERIDEVQQAFGKLRQGVSNDGLDKMISNDQVEGVPVLMLANKQDAPRALRVEEIKQTFNRIAVKLGARDSRVLPVSALKGEGVKEAVEWLQTRLMRNKTHRPPVYR
jgi:ADP-ribosylation factor related protein 1